MTLVKTCVWVQGSVLAKAIDGKGSAATKKQSNKNNTTSFDLDRTGGTWSWTKCFLQTGDISALENPGGVSLEVQVADYESEWNGTSVAIPSEILKDAPLLNEAPSAPTIVMANEWESVQVDETEPSPTTTHFSTAPDDLISLTHLHEPAVVHCLKHRYRSDLIYTATGPILLALNPFRALPALYDDSIMNDYWLAGEGLGKNLELKPHVYKNAHVAFRSMMNGLEGKNKMGDNMLPDDQEQQQLFIDQSMLVSGESGAGKTVTTKHVMKYLATLSQRKADHSKQRRLRESSPGRSTNETRLSRQLSTRYSHSSRTTSWKVGAQVEERVLVSNPILESFGNARTVRNDNSSRFGKLIELQFKQTGSLIGATINTYLLEKVRLVHQAESERTFHIFYEVLAASTMQERELFLLDEYTAKDFKMTNQSGTYHRRDGVEDSKQYDDLLFSMGTMGLEDNVQQDIIRVICAFLHASNLTFVAHPMEDSARVDETNRHLEPVLELLGLDKAAFDAALTEYEIEVGNQTYRRPFTVDGAENALQAFIKGTYAALFSFIVQSVNRHIDCKKSTATGVDSSTHVASISVLDIFGFESFQCNSFEQLCINYCNEALQQQFNRFIFKTEQEEYKREGIVWDFIKFPDNIDVIDLIDKSHVGILSILTEQCRTPHGTDKTFIDAIYKQCGKSERFLGRPLHQGKMQFIISHYAGPVLYDGRDFVEKNKEETPRGASSLLGSSNKGFVRLLGKITMGIMDAAPSSAESGRSKAKKRPTVASQFSSQLTDLRNRIEMTNPHYIRCLKPNQSLKPNEFDSAMIADQLRYAGVLEAIRVSRVGFSQRYTKSHFVDRYRFIAPDEVRQGGDDHTKINALELELTKKIWKSQHPNEETPPNMENMSGIQEGASKVFLRQSAFEYAEKFRNETLTGATVTIQSIVRQFLERCRYHRSKQRIVTCQACARRYVARNYLKAFREQKSVVKIQGYWRMSGPRRQLASKKFAVLWVQRFYRGRMGRQSFEIRTAATKLKEQQHRSPVVTQAVIPSDRAAAVAIESAQERTKEVLSLEALVARAKREAEKAKLALEGLGCLEQHLSAAMKELNTSKCVASAATDRARELENENKQLNEKLNCGASESGERYYNEMYRGYPNLMALDEKLHIASTQSKKSKAELKILLQALSVLN